MGELEFQQKVLVKAVDQALLEQGRERGELRLSTPGGRFQARWEEGCPLAFTSPSASAVIDVLGTCDDRSWTANGVMRMSPACAATPSPCRFWA